MSRARLSRLFLRLGLDVADQSGGIVPCLIFDNLEEQGLGIIGGQAGDALQFRALLCHYPVKFFSQFA